MKEFLSQFEELLKAEKFEEAKQLLSTFGSLQTTPEESAEAKLFITHLYLKLTNAVDGAYLGELEDAMQKLKILDAKEREIDEKAKLIQARISLAQ